MFPDGKARAATTPEDPDGHNLWERNMELDFKTITRRSVMGGLCAAAAALLTAMPALAAPPTLKYQSEIAVKAAPAKAWDSFKTFSAIHAWHPATEGTRLLVGEDGKALAVREFQLKGGGFVISELLSYNEAGKRFKYRIIKTNLPLANYVAEMWVTPGKNGGSVVHWAATFQRPDAQAKPDQDDAATEKLVQDVFKAGLDNLAAINTQ
jgi:mxaD protein